MADVVLGVSSATEFEAKAAGFNAITGRYANRIAGGRFTLVGKTSTLATNGTSGGVPVHIHGGKRGFNRIIGQAEPTSRDRLPAVRLRHRSLDGDEGYPGNLDVEQRLMAIVRWNALAMVVRANRFSSELGGHIASYASAADLFEVGFNHFWRAPSAAQDRADGDRWARMASPPGFEPGFQP